MENYSVYYIYIYMPSSLYSFLINMIFLKITITLSIIIILKITITLSIIIILKITITLSIIIIWEIQIILYKLKYDIHHLCTTGVWEHLWEKVWNNLKCLKRCAFQCIKVWKWDFVKCEKVWNQIKIWTLTSLVQIISFCHLLVVQ